MQVTCMYLEAKDYLPSFIQFIFLPIFMKTLLETKNVLVTKFSPFPKRFDSLSVHPQPPSFQLWKTLMLVLRIQRTATFNSLSVGFTITIARPCKSI